MSRFERINLSAYRGHLSMDPESVIELCEHIEQCYAEIDRLNEDLGYRARVMGGMSATAVQLRAEIDRLKEKAERMAKRRDELMSDLRDAHMEIGHDKATIDRLRASALNWVTVTDDRATLPKGIGAVILVLVGEEWWHQASLGANGDVRRWRLASGRWERLSVGDRWSYMPKVPA